MKKIYFVLAIIFCFCMIPKNVFAKIESGMLEVQHFEYSNTSVDTFKTLTVNSWLVADTRFYGYPFQDGHNRSYVRFGYNSTLKLNTSYDVDFVAYIGGYSQYSYLKPFTFFIKDSNGFITSCTDDSSISSNHNNVLLPDDVHGAIARDFTTVSCKNVILTSTDFYVYFSQFFSTENGMIGISKLSYRTNDSQQQIIDEQKKTNEELKKQTEATEKQTETIKNSDTSEANDSANSFFADFEDDDYGLSDVITMPLTFIQGLASSSCSSLNLPMPFVYTNVTLPCMTSIYSQYFGSFLTLYQIITTGFIAYWVCINIFRLVQGFKNPDNDEVEVMEL